MSVDGKVNISEDVSCLPSSSYLTLTTWEILFEVTPTRNSFELEDGIVLNVLDYFYYVSFFCSNEKYISFNIFIRKKTEKNSQSFLVYTVCY